MGNPASENSKGECVNTIIADPTGTGMLTPFGKQAKVAQTLQLGQTYEMRHYNIDDLNKDFRQEVTVLVNFYIKPATIIKSVKEYPQSEYVVTPLSEIVTSEGPRAQKLRRDHLVIAESVGEFGLKETSYEEKPFRELQVRDATSGTTIRVGLFGLQAKFCEKSVYEKQTIFLGQFVYNSYQGGNINSVSDKSYFFLASDKSAQALRR